MHGTPDWGHLVTLGLLAVTFGGWLVAGDMQGTPRTMERGLLLPLAGIVCILLGVNAWGPGDVVAIGLLALGILFATIGLYQYVLRLAVGTCGIRLIDGPE